MRERERERERCRRFTAARSYILAYRCVRACGAERAGSLRCQNPGRHRAGDRGNAVPRFGFRGVEQKRKNVCIHSCSQASEVPCCTLAPCHLFCSRPRKKVPRKQKPTQRSRRHDCCRETARKLVSRPSVASLSKWKKVSVRSYRWYRTLDKKSTGGDLQVKNNFEIHRNKCRKHPLSNKKSSRLIFTVN